MIYNDTLIQMISRFKINNDMSRRQAIRECMQEIALCGLGRSNFFNEASFYGGTCLRIFYGLNRFSEDLDFSLDMTTMPGFSSKAFNLKEYKSYIENEFESLGLNVTFDISEKAEDNNIKRGYIKGNTKELLLAFGFDESIASKTNHNDTTKIKLEVDSKPPFLAAYDIKFGLLPNPYPARTYDIESMFAGKISAVLGRNWQSRVKGRDFYDYVFYLKNKVKVNLICVEARMNADGVDLDNPLTIEELKRLLCEKFDTIDFENAKEDIANFIENPDDVNIWSADFFKAITQNLEASEKHVLRLCNDEELEKYDNRTRNS